MTIGEQMRGNPLPFLLVSAGVGLMIGRVWRNGTDQGASGLIDDEEKGASPSSSGHRMAAQLSSASEGFEETASAVHEGFSECNQEASDLGQRRRSGLAALAQEQPLVLGALGLLTGAALAAMLPLTPFEAQHRAGAAGPLRNGATGGPSSRGHDTGEESGVFGYQAGKGGARPSENVSFGQGSSGGYG